MRVLSNDSGNSAIPVRHWTLAWLGVAALIVFLFDPGIMSNDSFASLQQARTFEFTDWHPPIMALVWSVLDRIIPGPAGMLICQALLYAYGCSRLCRYAFPNLVRRFPSWLIVAVFSLFPPVMTLAGMIWKDIWMSGFLLLALAQLFRLQSLPKGRSGYRHVVQIVLLCLAATAFRHNAIAATAGLLAAAVFWLLQGRKWLPRFLLASIAGCLVSVILYLCTSFANSLIARPAELTTAIYLHDIAGTVVYSGDKEAAARMVLDAPTPVTDNPQQFLVRLQNAYSPAAATHLLRTSKRTKTPFSIDIFALDHDAHGVQEIRKALIRAYPAAYFKHRTMTFACLLQMCDRQQWIFHSYVMNERYALPATLDNQSLQYTLRRLFLSEHLAVLYHPGLWLLVTLVGGALGLLQLPHNRRNLLLFMGLSSAGLSLSLYFTSPIESYRYMHWTVLLGWTVLFLALDAMASHRAKNATPEASGDVAS